MSIQLESKPYHPDSITLTLLIQLVACKLFVGIMESKRHNNNVETVLALTWLSPTRLLLSYFTFTLQAHVNGLTSYNCYTEFMPIILPAGFLQSHNLWLK